jgi:hypothetical protein
MPRTVAPLTDTEIRKSKNKRLFDGGGLMLERPPSGARVCRASLPIAVSSTRTGFCA